MPLHTLLLTGLSGDNPLAFLAALGALRTARRVADSEIRLYWMPYKNSWCPALQGDDGFLSSADEISTAFHLSLVKENPAFSMAANANNPKLPAMDFRAVAQDALENWFDASFPEFVSFVTALGNESVIDENGKNEDTAFRTMSGAGHQHFLAFMRELAMATTKENIHEALFGPWKYNDTQYCMRWAPEDDRRYALRWDNPSGDPARSVRGANRLAVEGLPLYPTVPTTKTLATTGFTGKNWTWPLWTTAVSIDVCRSLLAHAELQEEKPTMEKLKPIGVFVVFRSQRITLGKFRNFTPATIVGEF